MKSRLESLQEAVSEWLQVHAFDYDCGFYSPEEWKDRGEKYLRSAELVFVFDNQLVTIFNYTGPWELEEELTELCKQFGYYFEFGNHWNMGFYPISFLEQTYEEPKGTTYRELLRDTRWQVTRKRILERDGYTCQDCGATECALDVHHCYYRFGRYPWQYPDGTLLSLCRRCHNVRGKVELKFRTLLPSLKSNEITVLDGMLRGKTDWVDRKVLFELIEAIGARRSDAHALLDEVFKSAGSPRSRVEGPAAGARPN